MDIWYNIMDITICHASYSFLRLLRHDFKNKAHLVKTLHTVNTQHKPPRQPHTHTHNTHTHTHTHRQTTHTITANHTSPHKTQVAEHQITWNKLQNLRNLTRYVIHTWSYSLFCWTTYHCVRILNTCNINIFLMILMIMMIWFLFFWDIVKEHEFTKHYTLCCTPMKVFISHHIVKSLEILRNPLENIINTI